MFPTIMDSLIMVYFDNFLSALHCFTDFAILLIVIN